jgi:hypothetical protein
VLLQGSRDDTIYVVIANLSSMSSASTLLPTYKGAQLRFPNLVLVYISCQKLSVPIRRELRDCLCRNGVLHLGDKVVYSILLCGTDEHSVSNLLGASPNHSLSLQSERASLYFNLCRGGVYSFTRRD